MRHASTKRLCKRFRLHSFTCCKSSRPEPNLTDMTGLGSASCAVYSTHRLTCLRLEHRYRLRHQPRTPSRPPARSSLQQVSKSTNSWSRSDMNRPLLARADSSGASRRRQPPPRLEPPSRHGWEGRRTNLHCTGQECGQRERKIQFTRERFCRVTLLQALN